MHIINIFSDDAFSQVSLTEGFNEVPFIPSLLNQQGIFRSVGIDTRTAAFEKSTRTRRVLNTVARNAPPPLLKDDKRKMYYVETQCIAIADKLQATELSGVRYMGATEAMETAQRKTAEKLLGIRENLQLTYEYAMLNVVTTGKWLDADGAVLQDWFDFFGTSQAAEIDFELDADTTDVRGKCTALVRQMARASNGRMNTGFGVIGLASDTFFDALVSHAQVRDTYLGYQAAADLRGGGMAFGTFTFGGITFINYRGTDDGTSVAIAAGKCHFFPTGTDAFSIFYGPHEDFETVNTQGVPVYIVTVPDRDRNQYVQFEAYTYPLLCCTLPEVLLKAKVY